MGQVGQSRSRILVAGDFAQRAGAAPLAERVPREVDGKTLPAWLWSQRVKLDLVVQNALYPEPPRSFAITLTPKDGTRLTPDAIVRAIPLLAGIDDQLRALRGVRNYMACIPTFRRQMRAALEQPSLRSQLAADLEASRSDAPEPHAVIRDILAHTATNPGDEGYLPGVDGVRHLLGERLRAGATTIDIGDVAAEIERIEALLRAQVTLLFVEPPFLALERAWHGLDRLVRHVPARVDAVACSEDELRADVAAGAPALQAWLDRAACEEAPFTAVLLAFDLDRTADATLLHRLAGLAQGALTPILVGTTRPLGMLLGAPLLVPLTSSTPVRPRYGYDDGDVVVRGFLFEEPPGGPPAAHWASGALVLARCLAPSNAEVAPGASEVTHPTQHLAYALALSRSSSSEAPPVAAP